MPHTPLGANLDITFPCLLLYHSSLMIFSQAVFDFEKLTFAWFLVIMVIDLGHKIPNISLMPSGIKLAYT